MTQITLQWRSLKESKTVYCHNRRQFYMVMAAEMSSAETNEALDPLNCLWPPCVADADIIFLPCGFFLSSIFYLFSFLA